MELTAVQSVVFKKLEEMMKNEPMILDNLKELSVEFGSFLPGSEDDEQTYLDIVYGVEDAIESFFLRMECRRNRFGFLMDKWCLYLFNCFGRTRLNRQMAQFKDEIKKLRVGKTYPRLVQNQIKNVNGPKFESSLVPTHVGSVQRLGEDRNAFTVVPTFRRRSINRQQQKTLTFTKSYDKHVDDLVAVLKEKDYLVFSVFGVRGSGKTTFASKLYRISKDMKNQFDCHAYVFVAKEYKTKEILLSLLKEVGNLKEQNTPIPDEIHKLGDRFIKHVENKKYLVVLEDVTDISIWEELRKYFPNSRNGSKVILTSSIPDVAMQASSAKGCHHDLERLSDEASWDIFFWTAGLRERSTSIEDNLKKKILTVCAGLPVNIVLLSGLFYTDISRTGEEWTQLLSRENWQTHDILSFSYKELSFPLILCLLYMALFPRDLDIPVRRLLRLWHAEGYVLGSSDEQNVEQPEDVVQRYFDELVSRGMIKISKWRSDDSARRCRLLGVLHDELLPKAQLVRLFYVHRNSDEVVESVRRIGDHANFKKIDDKFQGLRSYLSFNFPKKDTPAEGVGTFLKQIIGNGNLLLRVLDLEGVNKPTLPENLGELYNLRYLGLRWTYLDSIPASVGDLVYLETLDVKHTYINSLPISIWKLKQLQNLNLNENQLDMPMQDASLSELSLLTLWGLFLNDKIPVKNGWERLSHLRELGISFDETLSQEDLFLWIQGLTDLRSLRLRSKDDIGRPLKLLLEPLSKLLNLLTLNLVGNIEKLPEQCFPPNVKVLTLSFSRLKEDPMETLGQLSSLKVLRLLAESYIGIHMWCHKGGFPKLRVLKLWMLKLEHLEVAEGAMKNLEELNIRRCDELKYISPTLLKLENLVEITLVNMPSEFTANIKQGAAGRTSVNAETEWKFTSLPWEDKYTSEFYK